MEKYLDELDKISCFFSEEFIPETKEERTIEDIKMDLYGGI